jgi:hypothetical protein
MRDVVNPVEISAGAVEPLVPVLEEKRGEPKADPGFNPQPDPPIIVQKDPPMKRSQLDPTASKRTGTYN